jgi:hypothetical protein
MAALAEVLKAGIDAAKDVSWQIRCGKTQDLAFARVSRAVRLTSVLSAKLEADPGLEGFKPRARAIARCGTVAYAGVGGLGGAPRMPRMPRTAFDRMEEEWDRESPDDEERELDEMERDLEREPAEMMGEACRLLGIARDVKIFERGPDGRLVGSAERLTKQAEASLALYEAWRRERAARDPGKGGTAPIAAYPGPSMEEVQARLREAEAASRAAFAQDWPAPDG